MIAAVGKEALRLATGALGEYGNVFFAQAGGEKLAAVGFPQVQMDLRADVGVARSALC